MSQDKIQKARELVLNYIATHSLSDKLNKAVNEVCKSRPKDPWLFLSDIISEWTKDVPIIDRLVAKQGLDCHGMISLQLQLYGKVAIARPPRYLGVENVFIMKPSKVITPTKGNDDETKDNAQDTTSDDNKSFMKKVSEFLSPALRSTRIDEQSKIDGELLKLYEDGLKQESTKFNIIPTISSLIAVTTANYLRMPLYKYLNSKIKTKTAEIVKDEDNTNYTIPNIMCELTKSLNNKLPSICIVTTSTLRPLQRVIMITDITNELIKIIKTKRKIGAPSFDQNTGSILLEDSDCGNMEELLSMINTAISNCGKYEISTDLSLCISFTTKPSLLQYDSDKKQYTVENDKSYANDDITDYFNKLLDAHKEIEYLEDPLHETDQETYSVLMDKLNNKNMVIIGNGFYSSSNESIENGMKQKLTNAACIATSEMFTLTNALNASNMIQESVRQTKDEFMLMICDNFNDNSSSSYSVDLSIACNASLLRLSLPNSGQCANQYNRYLMISDELSTLRGDTPPSVNRYGSLSETVASGNVENNAKDETKANGIVATETNGGTTKDQANNDNIDGIGSDNDKTEEALP